MNPLILDAPAKLNLSLRVFGKREDGFREIDTLMVKLPGLCDHLEFREASEFSFQCDEPSVPSGEQNLVVKAVRAFEAAIDRPCKWSISLSKKIPHGAGLAGGSSNAATTLLGLNRLYDFPLKVATLRELAATLGSDIPFFLSDGASRCTGRGEKVEAVPSPPSLRILLLKPAFPSPTVDAYRRWKQSLEIPGINYSPQIYNGLTFVNDLERAVFEKHRILAELKQWLLERKETHAALMSGSGSTIFAVLHEDADPLSLAHSARIEIDPELWSWSGVTG